MDIDLDDLGVGDGRSKATARASRFEPKSGKHKTKTEPETFIPKKEEDASENVIKPKVEEEVAMMAEAEKQVNEEVPMEIDTTVNQEDDDDEDRVVREIDVFYSPSSDSNSQLYVLQYPLRPIWRPYDLDQKCEEVRVRPKSNQIEIDLSVDIDKNYNRNAPDNLKITKQTLSSRKVLLTTGYAVGILSGNKLHLNPVNAVVQLRPSMEHLKPDQKSSKMQVTATKSDQKPSKMQGKLGKLSNEQEIDIEEPWMSLNYYRSDNIFSDTYRQKMTVEDSTPIPFSMNPNDYLNSLCPGLSAESSRVKSLSLSTRSYLSLPLDERFKKWFSEGSRVSRFSALKHLAPDHSEEDILRVIPQFADLVQGLWVSKSGTQSLPDGVTGLARDYALLLFSENPVIPQRTLDDNSQLFRDNRMYVLRQLARNRPELNDWKFIEPSDLAFIKDHPGIVKEQERLWGIRKEKIMKNLGGSGPPRNVARNPSNKTTKPAATGDSGQGGAKKNVIGKSPGPVTMSDETREALPKALEELFRHQKVYSLQLIRQGLRDLAVSKSTPKLHSKAAVAAALGADAPLSELESIISQVAVLIHGVYVSKSSENQELNPLRSVVIDLFRVKESGGKLKKAEIVEALKIKLKRDISDAEFKKVISELCVSVKGNGWVLKSGDGSAKS